MGGVRRPQRGEQRGAVAIEFALVLPLFLMLVFGIIFFGFVFAQSLALGNAARQGARAGVVDDGTTTCGSVIDQVKAAAPTIGMMDTSGLTITVSRRDPAGTLTSLCATGSATNLAVLPCKDQAVGTSLYVKAVNPNTMILPFVPTGAKAKGEGEFRCEWQ